MIAASRSTLACIIALFIIDGTKEEEGWRRKRGWPPVATVGVSLQPRDDG
jgi:hypothetical protein